MIFTVSVKVIKRIKKRMHTRVRPFYGHMEGGGPDRTIISGASRTPLRRTTYNMNA